MKTIFRALSFLLLSLSIFPLCVDARTPVNTIAEQNHVDGVFVRDEGVLVSVDGHLLQAEGILATQEGIFVMENGVWMLLEEALKCDDYYV